MTQALTVRLATDADAELLWRWRNDAETRANSFSTAPVPWEEHRAWLTRQLADEGVRIFVIDDAELGPVAQVRYVRSNVSAEVHITVAPEARGRGVGAEALRRTAPLAHASLDVARIDAVIKKANVASLRAFERGGFVICDRATDRDDQVWHLELVQP